MASIIFIPAPIGGAGVPLNITTVVASPYAMLVTDGAILVDVSPCVILLPPAADYARFMVRVKDITGLASPVNPISVTPDGAETIDGAAAPFLLDNSYVAANFLSDGSEWWVF